MIAGMRLVALASSVFTPFDPKFVGTNSVDVTLDSKFWIQKFNATSSQHIDLSSLPEEGEIYTVTDTSMFYLRPKQFIKAQTAEKFTMPEGVTGMFSLRSAMAQAGLEQSTSVWVRPSWEGHLILELSNLTERTLILREGLRIGQVHFFATQE